MGILNKIKGFIKLSEVAADSAQTLLDTPVNQDANTIITQVTGALEDALRKQALTVLSTGNVTWSSNQITPNSGVDIVVKLLQNSTGQVINLNLSYANFSSGVTLTNDGDVFYIELDRTKITGTNVTIYNGGGNVGQRAVTGSGLPPLVNNQSGGLQGTICIPLAVRQGTNLWWVHGNFYWANGNVGNLGTPGATAVMPVGTVTPFAGSAISVPSGWLVCDGSTLNSVANPQYAALFSIIGTTYGGTGASSFKLPNCQGIFIRGAGSQIISGKTFTGTFGSAAKKDSTAQNGLSVTDSGHFHTGSSPNLWTDFWGNHGDDPPPYNRYVQDNYSHSSNSASANIVVSSTDPETAPANLALNYIIKY